TGPVAAPAPAGGNGGATDVGVTATSITLGNVSDLSGPQPGLFQTAVNGTNAYIAYVNSQGGLFGRHLRISVADAQTSCAGDRGGHQQLTDKVFAFAGSFSLFDSCGASVLASNPGIPDAHLAVTPEANKLPNNFSVNPIGDKVNNGIYAWAAGKFGADVVAHAAFMYVNLPAVTNVAGLQKRAAESAGWKFDYERAIGATETDFTADIIQMRQKGIKTFLTLFNADEMANFKPQADQQGFTPKYMAPLLYDQSFFKKLGGSAAAEGMYGSSASTLFFSTDDARNVPSVALFQKWYAQVSGGAAADTFAADAWAETALLVQAMRSAGPQLTRKKVLAELGKTTHFDADGFFAQSNPAGKVPISCYVIWEIRGGGYVRVDSPAKGFRCDGRAA
ncbi:MAG: ABC transporter substrate-binding protein, partial [Mycobacteriales bacterium]